MSLSLYVDGDRWRSHLRSVMATHPTLVPVIKGNGYGFGNGRLARKASWLGADTVAVGTYAEVDDVRTRFDATILVLTPWRPFEQRVVYDARVVHTVSRLADLEELLAREDRPRIVLERMTSMRRHGLSARELRQAAGLLTRAVKVEGVALHLPMAHGSHLGEAERLMTDVVAAGLPTTTVYVSHLTDRELAAPHVGLREEATGRIWLVHAGETCAARQVGWDEFEATFKIGRAVFVYDDAPAGRRQAYFAYVAPEPAHVHLGFEHGVLMRDAGGHLQGAGITRQVRWLTWRPGDAIDAAVVRPLVREGLRVARMSRSERFAAAMEREAAG